MGRESLFAGYREHVNAGKIDTFERYGFDTVMGKRAGNRFRDAYDPDRSWIKCHCNGGVFNLGHHNPQVLEAVTRSLDVADIGNHHLPAPGRADLASRLVASTGGRLPGVVFGVSGGEAVDLAIKVACAGTGRTGVISVAGGYHGHTGLALATGDASYREPQPDRGPLARRPPSGLQAFTEHADLLQVWAASVADVPEPMDIRPWFTRRYWSTRESALTRALSPSL